MEKSNFTLDKIVYCVLYLVIGILLCTLKTGFIEILMTIVGILYLIYGIYEIIKDRFITLNSVVKIIIGLLILILGWQIHKFVLLLFGILIAVQGGIDIFNSFKFKLGLVHLINAVVTITIGILLCIAPFAVSDIICIISGVIFIINGVLALFDKQVA